MDISYHNRQHWPFLPVPFDSYSSVMPQMNTLPLCIQQFSDAVASVQLLLTCFAKNSKLACSSYSLCASFLQIH